MARHRMVSIAAALVSTAASATAQHPAPAAPATTPPMTEPSAAARRYGAREHVLDISLSPDGRFVAYVTPTTGTGAEVRTLDLRSGRATRVLTALGRPLRLTTCGWSSATRLGCKLFARVRGREQVITLSRTVAVDWNGANRRFVSGLAGAYTGHQTQYDGDVIDWNGGADAVLIAHDWNPQASLARAATSFHRGFGVDRVDTRTGRLRIVEAANPNVSLYLSDGAGKVRLRGVDTYDDMPTPPDGSGPLPTAPGGMGTGVGARGAERSLNIVDFDAELGLTDDLALDDAAAVDEPQFYSGTTRYQFRARAERGWTAFSTVRTDEPGLRPVAIDGAADAAFATQPLEGRLALYRVPLVAPLKPELVSSSAVAGVAGVVSLGRKRRVIGALYDTIQPRIDYVDPGYRDLAASLSRELTGSPTVRFVAASADEDALVALISSPADPGHYDLYDRKARAATNWLSTRPALDGTPPLPGVAVGIAAPAGYTVEAVLTLPPGGRRTGLPAVVLARGGAYRDRSGFDWLAQFLAQAGYAVIQPALRGSQEVGDSWFTDGAHDNAVAVGDMRDAARWLVDQGIATPGRIAAIGWSWGGYAALEASVADGALFGAAVGIAPVTSVRRGVRVIAGAAADQLADETVAAGSPIRDIAKFTTPVLLFHGEGDLDVAPKATRDFDAALRKAGKRSDLVLFPGLDHELGDGTARAHMLDRISMFLTQSLASRGH